MVRVGVGVRVRVTGVRVGVRVRVTCIAFDTRVTCDTPRVLKYATYI